MPRGVYDREKAKKPKRKKVKGARVVKGWEGDPAPVKRAPPLSAIQVAELQKLVRELEADNHRLEQLVIRMIDKLV